ncbi:MAG TPA: PilZ domain-containing protein [Gammaproteobacteria bacterium]|nr:PilZ domain-containing protein [Gammaproteobacteria bacterium]
MRTFIRQPTRLPVEITAVDDPIESCQLLDIGVGGFCCKTDHTIPKGTTIGLSIPSRDQRLHAQGKVSWCRRKGDDVRIGVQFISANPESRLQLVERICDIERQRRLGRRQRNPSPGNTDSPTKPAH